MDYILNVNNNGRRQRRRLNNQEEDRFNSLPDVILTEILSSLPINSAATTSVLSRRWRHLWTRVTRFEIDFSSSTKTSRNILSIVGDILQQLTTPKLNTFHLALPSESNLDDPDATEPCFREVFRRNVDEIIFNAGFRSFFRVPAACVFDSQTLVILKLIGMLKIELPKNVAIQLPNLKKLSLCYLLDVPLWLRTMFQSCPVLEDLHLSFDLISLPQPQNEPSLVNIISPNLKSLELRMNSWSHLERSKISIDAPKLANLRIRDYNSFYYFLQNPSLLVNACIDLKGDSSLEFNGEEPEEEDSREEEDNYVNQMCKFFGKMSSVSSLELEVKNRTNIFTHLHSVNIPIFHNLVRLKTNCLKDLLHSLQYFPNLEHFEVSLWLEDNDLPMEKRNWCTPDSVPDCLANKLKTIQIGGLKGIGDDLKLVEYILGNAMVLEKLCIEVRIKVEYEKAVWKECMFCKSLFSLPKSSSNCEIVVSGRSVTASGDVFKNEHLTCNVLLD
ncbi:hypothetical protein SOVF_132550 [Spinacia oleracea]|nr:hypothetical protein SOVF_132550 [Spinacia oleracea]